MTQSSAQPTARPKRTLSEEQKAKMAAGRQRAAERRKAAQAEASNPETDPVLVKTNSAQIRERQTESKTKSDKRANGGLEAIAQRHVARDAGLVEQPDVPDEEIEEAPASMFHGARDAVPAPEADPELRDRPTVYARDDGDGEIQYITDIMAEWGSAIDAGTCFIRVERIKPSSWSDLPIKGLQRPIRQALTEDEFIDIYGGGTYDLVVYGPKRHGHRLDDRGNVRPHRLSKPIRVIFPLNYPPNIDAVLLEDEQDMETMQYQQGPFRRGARSTTADAHIHRSDLEFQDKQTERQRHDQRERLNEERKRADEMRREHTGALAELRQSHENAMQMLREGYQSQLDMMRSEMSSLRSELHENKTANLNKPSDSQLVIDLAKKSMDSRATDPEQLSRLESQHSRAREELIRQHNEETKRLRDEHRQELERMQRQMDDDRRRAEERVEQARKSIDERLAELQRQADNRVAEAEKRAERDIKYAKEAAEQRVRDTENSYKTRIEDLERGHTRDLRSKDDSFTMRRETMESSHQNQLSAKDQEITRLKEENTRLRAEADKPLAQRMAEQEEIAEHMGYVKKDGEPQDWKSTLAQTGMEVFGQLPQIIQSVSTALQSRRAPTVSAAPSAQPHHQLPPPVQGRGGAVAASRIESGWATSDGPDLDSADDGSGFDVQTPGFAPAGPTMRPVFQGDSSSLAPPTFSPEAAMPSPVAPPAPPPPQQPTQIVQQRSHQSANPPDSDITDEAILQYSQAMSAAVDQGADAKEYYDTMMQQFGPEMVEAITSRIDPARITSVLQQYDETNPLLRRDGQKFLHEIWVLARQQK